MGTMGSCLVADAFCTASMKRTLLEALERSDYRTAIPMRLYLERWCPGDPLDRAGELYLELDDTDGLFLLYIAVTDGKLAFVCDKAVTRNVGARFFCNALQQLIRHFGKGEYRQGVVSYIDSVSRELATYFPRMDGTAPTSAIRLHMGNLNEW